MHIDLRQGDCLELLKEIPDGSVDMVLADPPYGCTDCKWDVVIDIDKMWAELKRIIKRNGAIVLTAKQPFSSRLVMSNLKMFRYDLKWLKKNATGFLNANKMPLRAHEDILVFYRTLPTYNPQKTKGEPYVAKRKGEFKIYEDKKRIPTVNRTGDRHPLSYQFFNREQRTVHSTQKPVAMMEWLIKTYTNEGETVLDFTMGSGSTGVACVNTNRHFIGMELDEHYFNVAKKRIGESQKAKGEVIDENQLTQRS